MKPAVVCMSRVARAASPLMAACALAAGCATTQAPLPPELDLARAAIVFDAAQPVLAVERPTSMQVAVGVGAAGGMGAGVLLAAVGCLGSGPFYAFCLSLFLPASVVAGGLGGAVVGDIVYEAGAAAEPQRGLLKTELETASYPALLAEHVQKQVRERLLVDLPLRAASAPSNGRPIAYDASARTWWVELTLTKVGCGLAAPGQPFALRVEGSLRLRRGNAPSAVYEVNAIAMSDAALTTAEWSANGAEALRSGLDQSLRLLADKLLSDLVRTGAPLPSFAPVSFNVRRDLR